jgi:hypothetical protein
MPQHNSIPYSLEQKREIKGMGAQSLKFKAMEASPQSTSRISSNE